MGRQRAFKSKVIRGMQTPLGVLESVERGRKSNSLSALNVAAEPGELTSDAAYGRK